MILAGHGSESRHCQFPSIQLLGGDENWKHYLKHQFHVYWLFKKELQMGPTLAKKDREID